MQVLECPLLTWLTGNTLETSGNGQEESFFFFFLLSLSRFIQKKKCLVVASFLIVLWLGKLVV